MSDANHPDFTLKVLGPLRVEKADGSNGEGLSPSGAGLLAYLALQAKPLARDHLARLFWPRSEGPRARHSLRQLLSRLRARVPGLLVTAGEQVWVDGDRIQVDLGQFEREIREGRVRSALALWRGAFMEGWSWPESWELEDWVDRERSRVERLLELAIVECGEGLLFADRRSEALELLDAAAVALPFSDEVTLLRVRALAASGHRPEAESMLATSDLDAEDGRVRDTLEEIRNGNGTFVAIPQDPVEPPGPRADAGAVPDSSWLGDPRLWVSLTGAAALAIGFLAFRSDGGVSPELGPFVPPVEIWFCSQREEEFAFRMDENGDNKYSLTREEVCPVLPVNGGGRAVTITRQPRRTSIGLLVDGHFQLLAGPFLEVGSSVPARQAGPLDGTVSPDGRSMVVVLEFPHDGAETPALPRYLDGIGAFDTLSVLDLFVVDLEDGSLRQLTKDAARDYEPRFLPDGSGIIWGSQRDGPGDLYLMDSETGETERLTFGALPARDFSVQGDRVAYHRGWGDGADEGDQDLYLLDLTTGVERRLTENDWNDTGPELSFDGRMICWTSKKAGHWEAEIMAMELETGETWHVSDMPGREDYCQWHPSAPVVFFQVWGNEHEEVYRSGWGARGPAVNLSRHITDDHAAVVMRVGL